MLLTASFIKLFIFNEPKLANYFYKSKSLDNCKKILKLAKVNQKVDFIKNH